MVEFLSKFLGLGINIDIVNSILVAKSMIFFNILREHCTVSDVIMSYRFFLRCKKLLPLTTRSKSLRCVSLPEHQISEQYSKSGRKPRKHLISTGAISHEILARTSSRYRAFLEDTQETIRRCFSNLISTSNVTPKHQGLQIPSEQFHLDLIGRRLGMHYASPENHNYFYVVRI